MWKIGQTSKRFEVGKNGNAATISTGKGDRGGASYGLYQLSSKLGVVQDFVSKFYRTEFKGLTPATPAFNNVWKRLATSNSTAEKFAEDQHEYIKVTHFEPQIKLLKQSDINLEIRGPAILDMVWSTSVQFRTRNKTNHQSFSWKRCRNA